MKKFRPLLVKFILKVNEFLMRRECAIIFSEEFLGKLQKHTVLKTRTINETTRNYVLLSWLKNFCSANFIQ
jgi:hypothetical protein